MAGFYFFFAVKFCQKKNGNVGAGSRKKPKPRFRSERAFGSLPFEATNYSELAKRLNGQLRKHDRSAATHTHNKIIVEIPNSGSCESTRFESESHPKSRKQHTPPRAQRLRHTKSSQSAHIGVDPTRLSEKTADLLGAQLGNHTSLTVNMCADQWGPSPLQTTSSRHTQIIDGDILKQTVSGSHSRQRLLNQVSPVTSLGYQNRKRLKLISPLTAANRQKQKGFSAGKETASPAVSHMNWLEISHQLQYSNTPKQSSANGSDKSGRHTPLKSPARKGKNAIRNQSLAANLSGCRAQGKPLSVMDLLVYKVSGLELRGAASAEQAGRGRAVIKVPSADTAAGNPEVSRGTLYPDPPSPRWRRWKDSEESDSDSKEEGGGGGCQGGSSRRSEVRPKEVEVRARRPWVRGLGQVCGPRPQSSRSYDGGDGDRDAQSTWMDRLSRDEACAAGGATRWADSPDMTPGGEWPGEAVYIPKLDLPTTPQSSVERASPRAASRQRGPHRPPCPWGCSRPPSPPSPASDKATPRAPASHRPGQEESQGAASPQPECRIQELEYLASSDEDLSSPEDNTYFTGKILNISLSFGGRFSRRDVPADIPRILLTEDEDEEDGSL